ncbi:MAG: histidine phosphatase family protein [Candidatus Nealsonbacteria bacterium]|nr:histidine phosphatase family protein [Candidatus Nealsonbacteria bacterium]
MELRNQYFILRHGESLRNIEKRASCWPEKIKSPLTEKGIKQIKKSAKELKKKKISLIFSSDLLRTKQTAGIVSKEIGIKVRLDKRLREVNVGILNNKPIDEIGRFWDKERRLSPEEYYKKRFKVAPDKGENYVQLEKRMYDFFKETEKKYEGKNILIVSHQRPLTLLEKAVNNYNLEEFVKIIVGKREIKTGEMRKLA